MALDSSGGLKYTSIHVLSGTCTCTSNAFHFQSPTGSAGTVAAAQPYSLYPVQQSLGEFVYHPQYVAAPDMTEVEAGALAAAAAEVGTSTSFNSGLHVHVLDALY